MSTTPSQEDLVARIRDWAYSGNPEPQQDFDLIITGSGHERMFVELVADRNCPNRIYILSCLYLFVGDSLRSDYQTNSKKQVLEILEYARPFAVEELRQWIKRSEKLIASPTLFDYDLWCNGGYTKDI
jgi:hypothetical protein